MLDGRWIIDAEGAAYHMAGISTIHNKPRISVVAHALAQINRFNGHASRPYSVAEHSLLCADIAYEKGLPPHVQLACLMHDAHEAFTGDLSSPAKWTLGEPWELFEAPHARALRAYYSLQSVFVSHRADIKAIDLIALATERRDLLVFDLALSDPWPVLDTPGAEVSPWAWGDLNTHKRRSRSWYEWRGEFLATFQRLQDQCVRATVAHIRAASQAAISNPTSTP